jgi:hypothetical protein
MPRRVVPSSWYGTLRQSRTAARKRSSIVGSVDEDGTGVSSGTAASAAGV